MHFPKFRDELCNDDLQPNYVRTIFGNHHDQIASARFFKSVDISYRLVFVYTKRPRDVIGKHSEIIALLSCNILVMEAVNILNIAENNAFLSYKTWWNIGVVGHRANITLQRRTNDQNLNYLV